MVDGRANQIAMHAAMHSTSGGNVRRLLRMRLGRARRDRMLFFPLHPAVLEPYLDLALGEVEHVSNLDASSPGKVSVEVELLLQLQRLMPSVGRPRPLTVSIRTVYTDADTQTHM